MSTSPPDYPTNLLWNDRSTDPTFEPNELLYIRVQEVDERGQFTNFDVNCPNTSFNRSKYSRPEHVLYARYPKFLQWKVGAMRVDEIPQPIRSGDQRKFEFYPEHVPVGPPDEPLENYAHCEVRAKVNGIWQQKRLPRTVEKTYRELMARKIKPVPFDQPREPLLTIWANLIRMNDSDLARGAKVAFSMGRLCGPLRPGISMSFADMRGHSDVWAEF